MYVPGSNPVTYFVNDFVEWCALPRVTNLPLHVTNTHVSINTGADDKRVPPCRKKLAASLLMSGEYV